MRFQHAGEGFRGEECQRGEGGTACSGGGSAVAVSGDCSSSPGPPSVRSLILLALHSGRVFDSEHTGA
jgi:hypothetical protein